ncbi:hypothetical protein FB45DRAFT_1080117 [Roridomyces roridus]|uniref:FAD-binding PCMH-type domain-containing protein n=1 Tax=Roridomyces roridus TaxID=1738132 RepID=A0AAD7FND3_9AGAR|nr:hypothetical protein FB45DRAFT_1080117 [Roridomyces roridus]
MPSTLYRLFFFLFTASGALSCATECKCTSKDSCWPSTLEWAHLSSQLSRPIFHVQPLGYHCHNPHFDDKVCAEVQANSLDPIWRPDQPGAAQYDNLEFTTTSQCLVPGNRIALCGQGRVPTLGVNATTVSDLEKALKFAYERNLKVHIKNTGHDFLGRGLGPGSLMIWVHHFRFTEFSAEFRYAGGQHGGFPAVSVGPGTQWADAFAFAAANEVVLAGGIGALGSVGAAGGWPMGAGHNIISPAIGLGADNIVEIDLVLPNGTLVTANQYENTDLFWAVRGGGGPSFGTSARLVYKAHPRMPLYAAFFEANAATSSAFVSLLDTWHAHLPSIAEAGWSGYYIFVDASYLALMYLLPHGNPVVGNATLGPFIADAKAISGVDITTDASQTYPDFNSWLMANIQDPVNVVGYNFSQHTNLVGLGIATASILLPKEVFTNETKAHRMSEALAAMAGGIGQHVAGGVVAEKDIDFNAVHPSWRSALVDLVTYDAFPDDTSEAEIAARRRKLSSLVDPLRALTPGVAQYLNEPDFLIPDYPSANWGSHYERLLRIKQSIDPTNQLLVKQGVGAVGWDEEQICRL